MAQLRIGVLTCSDTRSRGEGEDTAGQALRSLIEEAGWVVADYGVCADDREAIAAAIAAMCDVAHADVVLTCGGTGLSLRDVTPEATTDACDRPVPGIAEHIRAQSLRVTPRAMLSRATAAQRGTSVVINLPGSQKAARETFGFVAAQLEHAVEMANGGGHG
jgi:molybdopterin adenylyltransferase